MNADQREELAEATRQVDVMLQERPLKERGLQRKWRAGGSCPWEHRYIKACRRLFDARKAAGWVMTRPSSNGSYYIVSTGDTDA